MFSNDSCPEVENDVRRGDDSEILLDADKISLDNWELIAFLREFELSSSSGKEKEYSDHAHIVCLLYKVLTLARGHDELSIGLLVKLMIPRLNLLLLKKS